MESLLVCGIACLFLQNSASVASCGETRDVSGVEGGDVTLPVGLTGIRDISWVTGMRHLAMTEPGNLVVLRHKLYKGRLSVTADGSLIIRNLSRDDQGNYTANIQRQISGQCIQIYNLTVYSASGASCGERRNVSGAEGGDVTLPVDQAGIRDIFWMAGRRHLATSQPGNPVEVHNKLYRGRLSVTSDGSLIIINLSRDDQGIYTAIIIHGELSGQCIQLYDLRVYGGQNSSTHSSSPTFADMTVTFMAVVVSVAALLVIVIVVLLFKYRKKTSPLRVTSPSQGDPTAVDSSAEAVWKDNVVYSYMDIRQKVLSSS